MSTLSEREKQEVSLLLPWYANGTLNSEDSRKVEAALAQDDALAREFDLVLEDQMAVVELVSEEEVPVSMAERFKAALNAEQDEPATSARPREAGESLINRIISVLFPARPRAYAVVAAVFILFAPAVVIYSIVVGNHQTGQYQTASGEEETILGKTRTLVKFNSDAVWTDIDAFLSENRGQIVKGPTPDGLYELAFEKADKLAEKMATETGIFEFVLPAN
ncbi:hypothetical protein G5B38_08430 [Pseudohalocynthiibacter aestuariivivens]|nr:hypothetical protein [Pseudohalocynthiibacter aestuariivivens]QIE45544.1 hypothetical protein G5B38_08430 [Pseudohalocynthiibacter aestuariivivens]